MLIRGFNLAAGDHRRSQRRGTLAAIAAAALVLLLVGQGGSWMLLRREATRMGGRLAEMEAQVRGQEERVRGARSGMPAEGMKAYEAKVAAYNRILDASAFSWTGLLFELERAVPARVELQGIQPDLASGKVILTGVSKSFEDLSRFLNALGQRSTFRDVYLLRQAERRQDASAGRAASEELTFTASLIYGGRPR